MIILCYEQEETEECVSSVRINGEKRLLASSCPSVRLSIRVY